MTTKHEWRDIIRKNRRKQLNAIQGRLYQHTEETLTYIDTLAEFVQSDKPYIIELVQFARRTFSQASLEQTLRLFNALNDDVEKCSRCLNVILAVPAGSLMYNALQRLKQLLDIHEHQTADMQDGSVPMSSATVAILKLITVSVQGYSTDWFDALATMHGLHDSTALWRLFEMCSRLQFAGIRSVLFTEPDMSFLAVNESNEFCIPAPKSLIHWVMTQQSAYNRKLKEGNAPLIAFADRFRANAAWYREQFQNMWLDMMVQPKWALRSGSIDCVSMDIPEFQGTIKRIRFETIPEFPNFRATFEEQIYTMPSTYTATCTPTDLYTEASLASEAVLPTNVQTLHWLNRVLMFIAVRCAWEIVMGIHSRQSRYSRGGTGNNGSAVVRPQFRRLPDGYTASPEARERALEVMKAAPLPGFTFVREFTRGQNPQSGDPLFAITSIEPEEE